MPSLPFVAGLLGWKGERANIADKDSETSCRIAAALLRTLEVTRSVNDSGQAAGKLLEQAVHDHLRAALPGETRGRTVEVSHRRAVSDFEQYGHLGDLKRFIRGDDTGTLRATIGSDYLIKPDVTVGLAAATGTPLLHAAVPCKWTLRSDRAQNIRHEAVVMIRHRRGRLPHITPVTAEPMPTRIASLARGTGEIDAVFHVALDELSAAVHTHGTREQIEALEELVGHGRLRDLADLVPTLLV